MRARACIHVCACEVVTVRLDLHMHTHMYKFHFFPFKIPTELYFIHENSQMYMVFSSALTELDLSYIHTHSHMVFSSTLTELDLTYIYTYICTHSHVVFSSTLTELELSQTGITGAGLDMIACALPHNNKVCTYACLHCRCLCAHIYASIHIFARAG